MSVPPRHLPFSFAVCLLTSLGQAQEEPESYFPLSQGTVWTYQLELKRGDDTQRLLYTAEVVGTEEVAGAPCFVVEHKSDDKLFQKTWYSVDAEGVIRNPRRLSGSRTLDLLEGEGERARVLFDPSREGEDARWTWRARDGSAQGTIHVEARRQTVRLPKPLRAEFDCLVLVEESEFRAGTRTATQTRRMWLAPGVGMVKETSEIRIAGEIATQSTATLYAFPRSG